MTTSHNEASIEAHPTLPLITITRDFRASVSQIIRAHTEPDLYARWVGPAGMETRIDHWDARRGGSWRFTNIHDGEEFSFFGSFHDITDDRIVQTFTWEAMPESVSLETLRAEALSDSRVRLHAQSLVDSIEGRDAWLRSGMEVGVNDGYAKLDALLSDGAL